MLRCGIIHLLPHVGAKCAAPDEVRVEEYSVLSSKASSDCDRVSVKLEWRATIFLPIGMTVLFLWKCSFHWDGCSVNYGLLSFVTW